MDVQFEDPEGAFFIRNDDDILPQPGSVSPAPGTGEARGGLGEPHNPGLQEVDNGTVQFTVVQSRQPLSLR